MKLNKILFSLMAAFSLLAVSCQEEIAYTPGEPDLEGCYGVYFPTQEAAGSHTMDPSETPVVEFVVKRTTENGDITVPVEVTASEEGIFNVSALRFADGQTESKITVSFDKAQAGTEYTLSLEITDPEYALTYGSYPTYLTYSVTIERYDLVGMATFREGLITGYNSDPTGLEWDVEVYTKESAPGWYFFKDAYITAPFNAGMTLAPSGSYLTINAENPGRVYMPFQNLGCDWGYGWMWSGSLAPEAGISGGTPAYGTLIDGVISFPANGMVFGEEGYNDFELFQTNTSGLFRICLPGAVLVDYSIQMLSAITENGVMPLQFTFGSDVAYIKYAAFEGTLSGAEIAEKAAEIAAGGNAAKIEKPADSNNAVVGLTFDKTGRYTIVALGYDANDVAQSNVSISVEYVAAGDQVPVVVAGGLGSAAKYAPQGFTTENALEFYVYGQDLRTVKIGLFTLSDLVSNQQGCVNSLLASASLPADILNTINTDVFVDIFYGLTPGTEYCMLVYANNGYEETIIMSDPYSTEGDALPVYKSFSAADFKNELLPATSEGYFGTYNYYAQYTGPLREYFGQVTIADSEYPDAGPDESGLMDEYVEISGLFAGLQQQFGIEDDTMIFDYYGGVIYALENALGAGSHPQIGDFYVGMSMGNTTPAVYIGNNFLMIGGFVDEGYLAFVTAPQYEQAGYVMDSFFLMAYADEYITPLGYLDWISTPLLVDPAVDDNGLAPAKAQRSTMSREVLNKLSYDINTDINFVETERGRIHSAIDKMRSAEKTPKAVGTMAGVKGEWNAPQVEFSTVEFHGNIQKGTSNDRRIKTNDAQLVLHR